MSKPSAHSVTAATGPSANLPTAQTPVLTPERRETFLENLATNGNVRLAARAASVSAQTVYRARQSDEDFAREWTKALIAARTHVEAVLADRAMNGVEEVVIAHGEEVARRTRYDGRLLLALLGRLDRLAADEEARTAAEEADANLAVEARMAAMAAARPCDALTPQDYADPHDVEVLQLLAFEGGMPEWWTVTCNEDLPEWVIAGFA